VFCVQREEGKGEGERQKASTKTIREKERERERDQKIHRVCAVQGGDKQFFKIEKKGTLVRKQHDTTSQGEKIKHKEKEEAKILMILMTRKKHVIAPRFSFLSIYYFVSSFLFLFSFL